MNQIKKRVALYLRVSTSDQSCELQRQELTAYAEARGWQIHVIYEDKATGTNKNRPMFKELIHAAKARKFDIVLCWKLDRFARSLKDLIVTLQELTEVGIDFISLKDQIDLTTAAGRLMLHIIGAFAEFEAAIIKERVRAGLRAAKAKGKRLGRPKIRDDKAIAKLRADGASFRQIAKNVGLSVGAIQRSLNAIQVTY